MSVRFSSPVSLDWASLALPSLAVLNLLLGGAPAAARAQPVNGFYLGGALGGAFLPSGSGSFRQDHPQTTPAPVPTDPSGPGLAGHGSFGYGLGKGLRFEMEGTGARLNLPRQP